MAIPVVRAVEDAVIIPSAGSLMDTLEEIVREAPNGLAP